MNSEVAASGVRFVMTFPVDFVVVRHRRGRGLVFTAVSQLLRQADALLQSAGPFVIDGP